MKWQISALSLMFLGGVAVGSMFNLSPPLYAQGAKGPVYGIYEANVTDAEGYKSKFLSLVAPKLEKHGIKYLARGGETKSFIGAPAENRVVITQAKDMDAEMAFWNEAKDDFTIGQKYSTGMRFIAVEGAAQ
jgi:uncharacterized protein (DUF1330 family)